LNSSSKKTKLEIRATNDMPVIEKFQNTTPTGRGGSYNSGRSVKYSQEGNVTFTYTFDSLSDEYIIPVNTIGRYVILYHPFITKGISVYTRKLYNDVSSIPLSYAQRIAKRKAELSNKNKDSEDSDDSEKKVTSSVTEKSKKDEREAQKEEKREEKREAKKEAQREAKKEAKKEKDDDEEKKEKDSDESSVKSTPSKPLTREQKLKISKKKFLARKAMLKKKMEQKVAKRRAEIKKAAQRRAALKKKMESKLAAENKFLTPETPKSNVFRSPESSPKFKAANDSNKNTPKKQNKKEKGLKERII
jgi:hypothetical protein